MREGTEWCDGLMYMDNRLVIPAVDNIQTSLISQTHKALGHLGTLKMALQLQFFWPNMHQQVQEFVSSCDSCQRNKAHTTLLSGRLQLTAIPCRPLEEIRLDFLGPFPKFHGYDMLLSCTCRLTGFVRIIPTCQRNTAEQTAHRLFGAWISIFGAPKSMIGDRNKAWTSQFWQELNNLLNININLLMAFHPEADGCSEKSNKTIGQILRHLTSTRHSKWFDALPAVEYTMNSAVNVATGVSPLEFVLGCKPHLFLINNNILAVGPDVQAWVEKQQAAWASFRNKLWQSRVKQAIQYNKCRHQGSPLKVGDWVLVDAKDRQQIVGGDRKQTSKLRPCFDGPY